MSSRLKKILVTMCLFILITKINYSVIIENLEETYIQIKVKKIKDDFFKVKYDYATDDIYIGCNNLFYLLEIFTLEVDIKNNGIKGELDSKRINVKFKNEEAFVEDDELYVKYEVLGKKLNFKLTKYNPAILSLEMEPNFTLAYEHRARGKLERIRLEDKESKKIEDYDLVMEGKLFRPGLLKLNYSFDDFREKNNYYLNYEYGTELLYGEYYMNGILKPRSEISTAKLTYSNFYKENDIAIGTFNMVTPSFLNIDTDVVGINLNGDTTYTRRENGITIIKGEAIGAESVEIYRNNVLLDYTSVINNNFKFEINDGILNSTYLLKIYYENGKIEEKWVYSLGDENLLENGKKRVVAQSGKSISNGDFQSIYGFYYGVNDYLTLGAEIQNLRDLDNNKYNFLKTSTILNTGLQNFPTLINYKNYLELNDVDFIHNISILQKVYDLNLKFQHDIYSEKISKIIKLKKESSLSISKGFKSNILELGTSKKKREDFTREKIDEKTLYLLWYTSLLNPVSFSLKVDKILTKGNEGIIYNPSLSYSRDFSIILDGRIEKYKDNLEVEQEYKLKLTKRQIELVKNKLYGDISLQAKYNYNRRDIAYGIAFNIELDDFIKVYSKNDLNIDKNKNIETSSGLALTKLINLNNPIKSLDNNSSVNNYIIQGKVFLDRNGNGIYDEGDEAVEGVEVLADTKGSFSNKNGDYIINDSSNKGDIILKVNPKTIDVMLKNTKGDLKIKVKNSRAINVDIPLEVISMVTGNIWNTDDFSEKKFTQNIANTSIELIKDNEIYKELDPEFDGMYFLDDITPGKYKLRFLYLGTENIKFEPSEIDIEIKLENPDEGLYLEGLDTRMLIRKIEDDIESATKTNELLDEFDDLINIE